MSEKLAECFQAMPIVAILRGVRPEEVVAVGEAIYRAGVRVIEVPLNSPDPLVSIERLAAALGERCVVGAGTVLSPTDAENVRRAGGEIAVTPNTDAAVIARSIELGIVPVPGWATPSDAFTAYRAGARHLKLFPAASYGPGHIQAVSAVLPPDCQLLAVGGVGSDNMDEWLRAGVQGFGIGTEIYKPGRDSDQVYRATQQVVAAVRAHRGAAA